MLMLMCTRKVGQILRRADAQDYSLKGKMGRDLSTMTVGVIGTGNIGRTVLHHLSGFGCRLLAYDLFPNEETRQYAEYVPLDTLYQECDIISLHTNATPENYHLINRDAIARMKDGVILINTARGTLMEPEALVDGWEGGKIGAAWWNKRTACSIITMPARHCKTANLPCCAASPMLFLPPIPPSTPMSMWPIWWRAPFKPPAPLPWANPAPPR